MERSNNAPPKINGFPAANTPGLRERWHLRQNLEPRQQIFPRVKPAGPVADDSETSMFLLAGIRKKLAKDGPMAATVVR